jgi:mRNA interferase MazF
LRPAAVLADAGRDDWIPCQITSNPYGDPNAISLSGESFSEGSLRIASFARPGKLFTASSGLMVGEVGMLKAKAIREMIDAEVGTLRKGVEVQDASW